MAGTPRATPRPLPVAALALALAACPSHHDSRQGIGGSCASETACQTGLVCFEGKCATEAPAGSCNPTSSSPAVDPPVTLGILSTDWAGCVSAIRPAVNGATDLGQATVGTPLSFNLPANFVGFSIVSQEVPGTAPDSITMTGVGAYPNAPVPTDILDPSSHLVFDDTTAWFDSPVNFPGYAAFDIGSTPQAGTFTLPNTAHALDTLYTAGALPAGTWSFRVSDYSYECSAGQPFAPYCTAGASTTSQYDVKVMTRPGPIKSTGTADLAVYFVSLSATAAAAQTSTEFARYVSALKTIFGRAGICIGTVHLYDLPSWARTRWWQINVDDATPCGQLAQLFTISQQVDAIQIFLVDDLTSSTAPAGSTIVGIDGTIPGPSGVPGTITSGAAVELGTNLDSTIGCSGGFNPAGCGPDELAYVTAHEAGHWLGLYHTTEAYAGTWDPLTDTATCTCDCLSTTTAKSECKASQSGGELNASYCASTASNSTCAGAQDLMFWQYSPGWSQALVSPQQARVMRLNPAVHW